MKLVGSATKYGEVVAIPEKFESTIPVVAALNDAWSVYAVVVAIAGNEHTVIPKTKRPIIAPDVLNMLMSCSFWFHNRYAKPS
jgi:hypothetical protein